MTPEQWQRARALFEGAIEQAPDARMAYVAAACSSDDQNDDVVRQEVLDMLAADSRSGSTVDSLGMAAPDLLAELDGKASAEDRNALLGTRVGAWRLVRELGHGGMGAVFLAERADGDFRQQAAVKLVRPGWDAGELHTRFRSERRILAALEHPNIAHLLDGGETADGKPYLVMEYVDGLPLGNYCDAERLSIDDRLRIFIAVCDAVAHAHRGLVVHRDLKPSNVLVDSGGQVKLLDFGIARLLTTDVSSTGSGLRLFTPDYAAPEQVRGDPVTTSVDVYALGLMLFELLTGRRPYGQTASTPRAYEQAILADEPARPSQLVTTQDDRCVSLAHARDLDPRQLAANLRGDLDAIVLKALRKEPALRYASVDALSDDVNRHLRHLPVSARRGNWRYRTARFVRRHWVAAVLGMLAMVSMLAGLSIALWQADKATQQRVVAQAEAGKARAVADFMTGLFKSADPANTEGKDPRVSELLAQAVSDIDAQTDLAPETRASFLMAMGSAYLSLENSARGLELMRRARTSALASTSLAVDVETRLEMARALDGEGQTETALAELEKVQLLVAEHPEVEARLVRRMDYMFAVMLQDLDRPSDALRHLEREYKRVLAEDGPGTVSVARLMELYAVLLSTLQRPDEAIAITRLNRDAALHNKDMPLARKTNFAAAYAYSLLNAKRPVEAETAYREALGYEETIYGVDTPGITTSLNNVAIALRDQGRYAESAALLERVVRVRRAHLEPGHPAIARALVNLGNVWRGAGESGKAIDLIGEGLAMFDKRGEGNIGTALFARLNLGLALESAGRFAEAHTAIAPVLARTREPDSRYAGARGAPVLLLQARLLAETGWPVGDCNAPRGVLAVATPESVEFAEAQILAADCEFHAGHPDAARVHLEKNPQAAAGTDSLSAFARTRRQSLERALH